MSLLLLLVASCSCFFEGQLHPPFKTVTKTAPTLFSTSSYTESGCSTESAINTDQERRKTRDIINSNYKFRPHQCGGPGWTRAYYLNMSSPRSKCPNNWVLHKKVRACRRRGTGFELKGSCNSMVIPIINMNFSTICGRAYAYQRGGLTSFEHTYATTPNIDKCYLSGLTLTHGKRGNRHHIWSFVGNVDETSDYMTHCSCINTTATTSLKPPSFVGNDYFCDTGTYTHNLEDRTKVYTNDPLWEGEGCGGVSTCCSFSNPPWFYKELNYSTRDDLELRLCGFFFGDPLVYLIEIFIH